MGDFHHLAPPRGKVTWTDSAQEALNAGAVWFDFLPPNLGAVDGLTVRLHFEMPPDPLAHPGIFERMVKDADAVVFVADSRRASMPANLAAVHALDGVVDRAKVPVVFLFTKRDLPHVVPMAELATAVRANGAPTFEGNATEKAGVTAVKAAVKAAILRHRGDPFW